MIVSEAEQAPESKEDRMPFETETGASEAVEKVEEPKAETVDPGLQRDAMRQMVDFLEALVPRDDLTICGAFGGVYEVPSLIPARRQIKVMRKIEQLMSTSVDLGAMASLASAGAAGAFGAIVVLAENEAVLTTLEEAFTIAHPVLVKSEAEIATSHGYGDDLTAADLFPVEELVGGLAPFFVRLVKKVLALMESLPDEMLDSPKLVN